MKYHTPVVGGKPAITSFERVTVVGGNFVCEVIEVFIVWYLHDR
jgi:hypothetical protein